MEDDSEVIARLATSAKFQGASMAHKTAILERHVDVGRLFGPYTWDTLPTRYLSAYTPGDKLAAMDAVARQRAGRPWPSDGSTAEVTYRNPVASGAICEEENLEIEE